MLQTTPLNSSDFLVISDSNWRQYAAVAPGGAYPNHDLAPALQGPAGYKGWQKPGEPHKFRGEKPVTELIDQSDWIPLLQAGHGLKVYNAILSNNIKAKNQGQQPLCWCYGSTRSVELRRVLSGLPYLDLAPESVAGPCTGWREEGGYASEAFNQIQQGGICENSYLDRSNPGDLSKSRWKSGWQDNAKSHEVVDWFNIDGSDSNIYAEVISVLLGGGDPDKEGPVAAGLDWWGHLVCFLCPVILPKNQVGILFMNSWDVDWPNTGSNGLAILTQSRATPDGAASPIVTNDVPAVDPTPEPDPTL